MRLLRAVGQVVQWAAAVPLVAALAAGAIAPRAGRAQPPQDEDGSPAAVFHSQCARCHGERGHTDTAGARALKVAPLVNDPRLAAMTPEAIVALVKADPKHRGVVKLRDEDLLRAASFVRQLARERQ
jgi:mono/diheme cytochrome c family protein